MIAAMALRLLYLIFNRLLDSLTLLGRASTSKNIELVCPKLGSRTLTCRFAGDGYPA